MHMLPLCLAALLLRQVAMLLRVGVVLDVRPPHRRRTLHLPACKLLRPHLLPQAQVVVVHSSNLAPSSDNSISRTLAEPRQLELERRQRELGVGLAEQLDTRLPADTVHGVRLDDRPDSDGTRGIKTPSGDPFLQPPEVEGRVVPAGEVDETALRQESVEGSLTTLEGRCGLAGAAAG